VTPERTLEVVGLDKRLGGRPVLRGIDLRCGPGGVVVILGENGAGKSTLLRLLAGILEPDRGQIVIAGAPLAGGGVAARRALGYVPDAAEPFPELLVEELLGLCAALRQAPPPTAALVERLGVVPFLGQRTGTLSFGQRKRAYLRGALIGDPWLLILDEPTNGLDPGGVALLHELLGERRERGQATLIATNDRPFALACAGALLRLADGQLGPA